MEPFVHYNIYFQMAGFVFLAALALVSLLRQGAHTLTRTALHRLFASAMTATALDVLATPVRAGAWPWLPGWAAHLLLVVWLISQYLFFACFVLGILFLAKAPGPRLRRMMQLTGVLCFAGTAAALLSPWLGLLYRPGPAGGFENGPLALPLMACCWLLLVVGCLWLRSAQSGPGRRCAACMAGLLLTGLPLQLAAGGVRLFWFITALALLPAALGAPLPGNQIHTASRCPNYRALVDTLWDCYQFRKPYCLAFLRIAPANDAGGAQSAAWMAPAAALLRASLPRCTVFFLSQADRFVVFSQGSREGFSSQMAELASGLNEGWLLGECTVTLTQPALLMDGLRCAPELDQAILLLDLLEEFTPDGPAHAAPQWVNDQALARLQRTLAVRRALTGALERGRFALRYLPVLDARTGKPVLLEVLPRIDDEQLGLLGPDAFVPIAERCGLTERMGAVIFDSLLAAMAADPELFSRVERVSINLSPLQLAEPDLADRFIQMAREKGVPCSRLAFELTESRSLRRNDGVPRLIRQLFAAGAAITVDDFGAGHSNLTRILDLPEAGAVKLDRYVMRTCLSRDPRLLAHLINFVHDCGKLVIAQGVESRQQAQQLVQLGADYLQGFYYTMPLDEAGLRRFLHCGTG